MKKMNTIVQKRTPLDDTICLWTENLDQTSSYVEIFEVAKKDTLSNREYCLMAESSNRDAVLSQYSSVPVRMPFAEIRQSVACSETSTHHRYSWRSRIPLKPPSTRGKRISPLFVFSPSFEETGSVLSNATVISHIPLFRQNLCREKENAIIMCNFFLFSKKRRTGKFQPFYDVFEIPVCFGMRKHPSSIRLSACRIRRRDAGSSPSSLLRRRGSGRQENRKTFFFFLSLDPSAFLLFLFLSRYSPCSLPKTLSFISEGIFSFSFCC